MMMMVMEGVQLLEGGSGVLSTRLSGHKLHLGSARANNDHFSIVRRIFFNCFVAFSTAAHVAPTSKTWMKKSGHVHVSF